MAHEASGDTVTFVCPASLYVSVTMGDLVKHAHYRVYDVFTNNMTD